ncbi:hydroxymethylbilane synthase [Ruminiclostridium josui]|jgi:hydroxymethylbilane synthase|uniref:hydroxymethylbilane synthase n=1 Tax=Ruminiclostridium josui TaxID=1499 RepID=UPI0004642931|nr:hydroxymethylbilane synthase [Ruminiclostridium josui]
MKTVRVGSRDSGLAVIQAQMVIDAIKKYDSNIEVELVTMKTTGDRILDKTLDKIGGKGLFVKELDEALRNGGVDITVHSYKDMPMEINSELPVVALSEREDERDVLILPVNQGDKSKPLGCSSKRRMLQLKALGFDNIEPLRGNVITRLKKLDDGEYCGIILAAAGIKRLGLENRISRYFTTEEIMPAACQGIIAVQTRKGEDTRYLANFHSERSKIVSDAERAFVAALDGGCSSPVAAYAYFENDKLVLRGLYVNEEKNIAIKGIEYGRAEDAVKMGISLAKRLKGEAC